MIVIDRDSKRTDIYRLLGPQYVMLQADRDGWLASEAMDVGLKRGGESDRPVLLIEDRRDSSKRGEI